MVLSFAKKEFKKKKNQAGQAEIRKGKNQHVRASRRKGMIKMRGFERGHSGGIVVSCVSFGRFWL